MIGYFIVKAHIPDSMGTIAVEEMIQEDIGSWQGSLDVNDVVQDFDRSKTEAYFIPNRQKDLNSIILESLKKPYDHTWFECDCHRVGCQFCDGGLGACTVCGGFEGSLATECPGKRLSDKTLDAIWKGYIDFKAGRCVPGRLWWDGRTHTITEWAKRYQEGKR